MDVEIGLMKWQEKIEEGMIWSDPIRPDEFTSFIDNTQKLCAKAALTDLQLAIHQKRREEDLQQKTVSRKRLKPAESRLRLTKEKAEEMIMEKEKKEKRNRS